ncbi:MAG TPA: hypothetical protein VIJ42_03185 [Stellaceae bacterium]
MSRIAGVTFAGAVLLALAMLCAPSPSRANPFFAQQTGQPCSACHLPGQEPAGRDGLNPTGLGFLACGETPSCFGVQGQQFQRTTQNQSGVATFTHKGCGHRPRYVTIRVAGSVPVPFILDRGMEVHVVVSQNSTVASACGGYPGNGAQYQFIVLD